MREHINAITLEWDNILMKEQCRARTILRYPAEPVSRCREPAGGWEPAGGFCGNRWVRFALPRYKDAV